MFDVEVEVSIRGKPTRDRLGNTHATYLEPVRTRVLFLINGGNQIGADYPDGAHVQAYCCFGQEFAREHAKDIQGARVDFGAVSYVVEGSPVVFPAEAAKRVGAPWPMRVSLVRADL